MLLTHSILILILHFQNIFFAKLNILFSDERLELHPIGLLLILIKNLMKGNLVGQEQLLRKNGIPILGELLTKVYNICLKCKCKLNFIFFMYRFLLIKWICRC